ncbi:MAG: hypothetical protein BWY69_00552 [Planctomycetes bacterium ADurb.Bin401]|nr:MAG: hypothetical protein BWY69_00552 [Planctomycetes bacterium ADurb.Bin401]
MINKVFDRMDLWRHLPNYQLERRADLFFSLYLPEVLKSKLGIEINPVIIPEFPVRIGTIYPNIPIDKSYKIDYVCFSQDTKKVLFVELKTESMSRREAQDKYLSASCKVGFASLVEGLIKIFKVTSSKRKYFNLLNLLLQAGFIEIPEQMFLKIQKNNLHGINALADRIKILDCPNESEIVYVQPVGTGTDIISFDEFKTIINQYDDPVSKRFAQSLSEWGRTKA